MTFDLASQRGVGADGDHKAGREIVLLLARCEVFLISDVMQKASQGDEIAVVDRAGANGFLG